MFYSIQARSKRAQQAQRFFDEDELMGRRCTTLVEANRKANAFAEGLNKRKFLTHSDWTPEVVEIDSPFKRR